MTIKQIGDDEKTAKYQQKRFTMKLELMNGNSHFSEEDSNMLESLAYTLAFIIIVGCGNLYFWHKD